MTCMTLGYYRVGHDIVQSTLSGHTSTFPRLVFRVMALKPHLSDGPDWTFPLRCGVF